MKRSNRLLLIIGLSFPLILAAAWFHYPPLRLLYLEQRLFLGDRSKQLGIFLELRGQGALRDEVLLSLLAKDSAPLVRGEALKTLVARPRASRRALTELSAIYADPAEDYDDRRNAAAAIAALGADAAPAEGDAIRGLAVLDMIGSFGAIEILQALARTRPTALAALSKARSHPNPYVGGAARRALQELLKDPDPEVQARVKQALEASPAR